MTGLYVKKEMSMGGSNFFLELFTVIFIKDLTFIPNIVCNAHKE